ncbi:hypothetical protein SAMN04488028_102538 [Reichenbachiella agariperforans]|uniref:CAAX prenyl protease 2/Lysostaphin resistance protein A-like domain-containing protein n=1 Tax=Reichenbachiella agariperforans TaxID=156994 RepID=A0A1M6P412_REIAG|nr:CPBP family intramembrane glutamic endopeptidase [Reichenbachiella agariperforans]SHK02668.1 hypothetical protein SAMN04488028_102538 [Reichenbachiella agariperforans]
MSELLSAEKKPLLQSLIIMGYVLATLFIAQFLALLLLVPVTGMGVAELLTAMAQINQYPELKWPIVLFHFLTASSGFIAAPLLYIYHHEKRGLLDDFRPREIDFKVVLLVIAMVFSFIVVDSVVIEWNADLVFPEPFQSWAKAKEEAAMRMTEFLTEMDTVPYFIVIFLVVAVLPAVGEELLFRGLIQKYLIRGFKNPHVAIWVTAMLFSAFHFQFFGFVPRMLLGALFGYFYYYSGNLLYAILAHFVNNGLTILMLYLYQNDWVDFDIENTESIPLESVGIFAIIGIGLFVLFTKQFKDQQKI